MSKANRKRTTQAKLASRSQSRAMPVSRDRTPRPMGPFLHQRLTLEASTLPLPTSQQLQDLRTMVPDAPERFVKMLEEQQQHRHHIEMYTTRADVWLSMPTLAASVIIVLAFLIVSAIIILHGYQVAGSVLATVDLVGLIGAILHSRRPPK